MRRSNNSCIALIAAIAAFSGCATAPTRSDAPDIALPRAWTAQPGASATAPHAWLKDFNEPQLQALVDEALAHNTDLHLAAARFSQSVAEARIAGAALMPSADLGLNGARQKINTFGPQSTGGIRFDNYSLNLNLSWEIDLWGRLRNRFP